MKIICIVNIKIEILFHQKRERKTYILIKVNNREVESNF